MSTHSFLASLRHFCFDLPVAHLKDRFRPSFKVVLALQLLLGGFFLFKALGLARFALARFKLQALAAQRQDQKRQSLALVRKKVLKKSAISREKQDLILSLPVAELQLRLLERVIDKDKAEGEALTVQEVLLVFTKAVAESKQDSLFGDVNFKGALEQAEAVSWAIASMIKFQQEIELHKNELRKSEEPVRE